MGFSLLCLVIIIICQLLCALPIREVIYFVCRSSEDQEVLFDQILMGQLEFPLPYWDNVSETAKVNIWNCTDLPCFHAFCIQEN